jgi:hypothetical protein
MEEREAAQALVDALADLIEAMPEHDLREGVFSRLLGFIRRDYGLEAEPAPPERTRHAWSAVATQDRERLALELLGEDRLLVRELTERFREELPDCLLYDGDIQGLVRRLVELGELDRKGERYRRGDSIRYRYFRKAPSPEVAALERALNAPSATTEQEG